MSSFDEIYNEIFQEFEKRYENDFNKEHWTYLYNLFYTVDFNGLDVLIINDCFEFFNLSLKRLNPKANFNRFEYGNSNNENDDNNDKVKDKSKSKEKTIKSEKYLYNKKGDVCIYANSVNIDSELKQINNFLLNEGILIVCIENEPSNLVQEIEERTVFKLFFGMKLYRNNIKVNIKFFKFGKIQSEDDNNYVPLYICFPKIGGTDPKRKITFLNNFLLILPDGIDASNDKAKAAIYLPLFKLSDDKSIILNQKQSIFDNSIYNDENKSDFLFNFPIKYKLKNKIKSVEELLNPIKENMLLKNPSLSDPSFKARLLSLPGYKSINDPINIIVNVRITIDGIFIYSSMPTYHIVFADLWNKKSYATPLPYMETSYQLNTTVCIVTKESKSAKNNDEYNSDEEIQIQRELGLLFDCEKDLYFNGSSNNSNNEASINSSNKNEDTNLPDSNSENENPNNGKIANNDNNENDPNSNNNTNNNNNNNNDNNNNNNNNSNNSNNNNNNNNDSNDDNNSNNNNNNNNNSNNDDNDNADDVTESKNNVKDKNASNNDDANSNAPNSGNIINDNDKAIKPAIADDSNQKDKDKSLKKKAKITKEAFGQKKELEEKISSFFTKPNDCIILKLDNVQAMMDFVNCVTAAISLSISSGIRKRFDIMLNKLEFEKKTFDSQNEGNT